MFRKVDTEQYPEEKKPTAPRFHGRHQLNRHPDGLEKCIGCELCAWACPADAIYVEGADTRHRRAGAAGSRPGERYGRVYQINYLRCIFCGLCIEACPTRALTMTNEYELADDNRADLIFEKDELLAPLRPGMLAAAAPDGARAWRRATTTGARSTRRRPSSGLGRRNADAGRPRRASRGRPASDSEAVLDERHSVRPCAVLDPRADHGARRARPAVRPQGRARALCSRSSMITLGVLLHRPGAPFLGVVQIVVYTGAVMMLFLFVLMLVGVDSSDSLVETIRGQRCRVARCSASGLAALLIASIGSSAFGQSVGLDAANRRAGNVTGLAG